MKKKKRKEGEEEGEGGEEVEEAGGEDEGEEGAEEEEGGGEEAEEEAADEEAATEAEEEVQYIQTGYRFAAFRTCTKQRLAKHYGPLPVPLPLTKAGNPDVNVHTLVVTTTDGSLRREPSLPWRELASHLAPQNT